MDISIPARPSCPSPGLTLAVLEHWGVQPRTRIGPEMLVACGIWAWSQMESESRLCPSQLCDNEVAQPLWV